MRELTVAGESRFEDWLRNAALAEGATPPVHLLDDADMSLDTGATIELLSELTFRTRFELGQGVLRALGSDGLRRATSRTWNTLSLLLFDQLCERKDGRYLRRSMNLYYLRPDTPYWDAYKHLVAGSVMLAALDPESSAVLLNVPPSARTDAIDQFLNSSIRTSIRSFRETFVRLYFEPHATKGPQLKRGAASKHKAGGIRRFGRLFTQIELTYDALSMTSDDVIGLLPREFDAFK